MASFEIYSLNTTDLTAKAKTNGILNELQGSHTFQGDTKEWPATMYIKIDFDDTTGEAGLVYSTKIDMSTPFLCAGYKDVGFLTQIALIRSLGRLMSTPMSIYEVETADLNEISGYDYLPRLTAHRNGKLAPIVWPSIFYITLKIESGIKYLKYYTSPDVETQTPFLEMTSVNTDFQEIADFLALAGGTM